MVKLKVQNKQYHLINLFYPLPEEILSQYPIPESDLFTMDNLIQKQQVFPNLKTHSEDIRGNIGETCLVEDQTKLMYTYCKQMYLDDTTSESTFGANDESMMDTDSKGNPSLSQMIWLVKTDKAKILSFTKQIKERQKLMNEK